MERSYKIYIHTNKINGKVYIGQTCQKNVKRRWNGGSSYKGMPFGKAIAKYGWSNFSHEILEDNLSSDEADEREKYYIKKYKSNNRKYGYNAQDGGKKHRTGCSKEGRASIRFHSTGENSPVAKRVDVYDFDGNYICTCKTLTEASKKIGVGLSLITISCKTRRRRCGYFFRLYEETYSIKKLPQAEIEEANDKHHPLKPIAQYDMVGNLIKIFPSTKQAHLETGVLRTEITECANHPDRRISAGGYMWRFGKDAPHKIKPAPFEKHEEGIHIYSKAVEKIDKKTNEIICEYPSLKIAAKENNVSSTTILRAFSGKGMLAEEYIWRYKYK